MDSRNADLRQKMPAHPPRTAAARARRPMPPPSSRPRQLPCCCRRPRLLCHGKPRHRRRNHGETLTDPELTSVPRPPMPVR